MARPAAGDAGSFRLASSLVSEVVVPRTDLEERGSLAPARRFDNQ